MASFLAWVVVGAVVKVLGSVVSFLSLDHNKNQNF